ncbi:N6-adenosine-methyltransferase 70 kDa subunit [Pelomyxa schiedti]|nr:N6-adenosine-methyltransferase 70 kDa subunit [Pelomyxa schiedti]
MDTCQYVHYEIDRSSYKSPLGTTTVQKESSNEASNHTTKSVTHGQWIQCDIRLLDLSILGKYSIVMIDPPWDIHMELTYGTLNDDEIQLLNIQCLQDDGYMFLWVTGRAMEKGRECIQHWGYRIVQEIVWIKTNQLQRIIRTGRTGHWLNHSKEHCLVAVKGFPSANTCIDCDVIVSEVRETSRKPDELYDMIERLSPNTRKVELFGRQHNVRPGWLTLGNQLDGTFLYDHDLQDRLGQWEASPEKAKRVSDLETQKRRRADHGLL